MTGDDDKITTFTMRYKIVEIVEMDKMVGNFLWFRLCCDGRAVMF